MTGEQIALLVLVAVIYVPVNIFYYAGAAEARRLHQRRFIPVLALSILMSLLALTAVVLGVLIASGVK